MSYALQDSQRKDLHGNVVSGPNDADTIAMTRILFGGRAAIGPTPATIRDKMQSPLRWDDPG